MDFNSKKTLAIIGLIIGAICIILTFVSDVFLIVGFLIIGVSFLLDKIEFLCWNDSR